MPIQIYDLKSLIQEIFRVQKPSPQLILIGGYSRSGKSTLSDKISNELGTHHLSSRGLSLDSWILSHDQRRTESTVLERFDSENAQAAILDLLQGRKAKIPFYDSTSRCRIESQAQELVLDQQYLIVEGVVALALPRLLEAASISIFVDVDEELRQKRLLEYMSSREIPKQEAEIIIASRENEEVPFIKGTREKARVIYR